MFNKLEIRPSKLKTKFTITSKTVMVVTWNLVGVKKGMI